MGIARSHMYKTTSHGRPPMEIKLFGGITESFAHVGIDQLVAQRAGRHWRAAEPDPQTICFAE
jgi:hypothetical protein